MIRAVRAEQVPNLFLLRYSSNWLVTDLPLIPSFFFTESVIERRRPLSPLAHRAGWVGCNILLNNIAQDGRIPVVTKGVATSPKQVRNEYQRLKPLSDIGLKTRGWTLDVLNVLRRLGRRSLSLSDLYQFEGRLQALHPDNKNIRPKIRQQMQVLRDLSLVAFEGGGRYRVLR
jgi:type II restriction enzyme